MRKIIAFLMVACLVCMMTVTIHAESPKEAAATQRTEPVIIINGEQVNFNPPAFIFEWVTLAPADELLTALGYTVRWDESTLTVIGVKTGKELRFSMNSSEASVNGTSKLTPKASRLINGVPFIPLRFAAEADGSKVRWHSSDQSITIDKLAVNTVVKIVVPLTESEVAVHITEHYEELSDRIAAQIGTRIQWILTPISTYQERVNLFIASGDLPHLLYISDPGVYPPDLIPAISWDLSEYIKDYSNLNQLPQRSWDELTLDDGSIRGIPKAVSPHDAVFPVVRQDWLDKLGLAAPSTMEELYLVMKLFAEYDPDGNGKNDTIGLSGASDNRSLGTLSWVEHVFNESSGRFVLEDGVIVDTATKAGTREALQWLNRAYKEGLLDPEFAVSSNSRAIHLFEDHKSGIVGMTMQDVWRSTEKLHQSDEWAQIAPLVSLKRDGSGKPVTATRTANNGMFMISTMSKKEELDLALEVLDALHAFAANESTDIETRRLVQHTIGVQSEYELSHLQFSDPVRQRFENILLERSLLEAEPHLDVKIQATLSNDQRFAMHELDRRMIEMKIKYIMGAISIEQWDDFIAHIKQDEKYVELMKAIQLIK